MIKILMIGSGGFIGAVSRYLLSGLIYRLSGGHAFPFGTMFVNVLGCFLVGYLDGVIETRQLFNEQFRLFLFVGILGGFTTFSAFSQESISLIKGPQSLTGVIYIFITIILCLLAAWAGHHLTIIKT